MQRLLLAAGVLFLVVGLLWPWLSRVGLGQLPGDLRIQRPGFAFFAPLGSSLVVSVVLSVVVSLVLWVWRR